MTTYTNKLNAIKTPLTVVFPTHGWGAIAIALEYICFAKLGRK